MSSLSADQYKGSDKAGSLVFEHDGDGGGNGVCFRDQTDRDAAEGGNRHVQRHADAAYGPPQHHALAVQVDDAEAFVGRVIGGLETHRQREGVEPQHAARPGSDPADFHLTPRKTSAPPRLLPPGCRDNARARSQSA